MDLQRFGFTPTEHRVYLALLRLSQATGYAVAQEASLARANTYSALEGLAARGVVTRLPGRPAKYAAIEPGTVIGRLRHELTRDLELLEKDLSRVERPRAATPPSAVEQLSGRSAILTRAAACARSAREELLAVVGPWASPIFPDLEGVRLRSGPARLLSLGKPAPLRAALREVAPLEIASYWGGLPIALVADRKAAVCGIFGSGEDAAGIATEHSALIPFVRHLLRRELAAPPAHHVS